MTRAVPAPQRQRRHAHPAERRRRARAVYPTVAAFYNSERRRLSSSELDFGLWWREGLDGPLRRAAWVNETGELYTVRLGPPDEGGGEVEVLGVFPDRERLERTLAGWRGHCGEPSSLGWLRGRARTDVPQPLRDSP